MALTPESLTEQQMQPLARSSHSSACWSSWETVRDFSMSVLLPNSVMEVGERSFGCSDGGRKSLTDLPFRMTAIFLPWRAVRM